MAREKFEEALRKLEDILRKMEAGDMTLEESLKSFEEGMRLSRLCAERLDDAERRVDVLLKEDGKLTVKSFAGEESDG
jgi:exodeoxyribonuclease VII small subunit